MPADPLGPAWTAKTLPLAPDAEGEKVATLVHRTTDPAGHGRAILYVHGFVDYFFQAHFAEAMERAGWNLFALDLSKYGRSLRPHQTPNFTTDLHDYFAEIDAALAEMRATFGVKRVVLLGHSTGGLTAALYAHHRRGRGAIDGVVLNSPWLDLQGSDFERGPLTAILKVVGAWFPKLAVSKLGDAYGRSIHRSTGGEWDYDLAWKPLVGFPVLAGFVRAVRLGHAEVAAGLAVDVPVLVATSTKSGPRTGPHPEILSTDSVLDVEQMAARAPGLGPRVELVRIAGGIHDLALSPSPAREAYVAAVTGALGRWFPS